MPQEHGSVGQPGGNAWLQLEWLAEWEARPITEKKQKKLVPIVLACAVWGKQWQGKEFRCGVITLRWYRSFQGYQVRTHSLCTF